MQRIRVDLTPPIATLFLARPAVRNALDREMADEIVAAVAQLELNNEIRVLVVRGDGNDFCAGADLAALHRMIDSPAAVHEDDALALGKAFLALSGFSRPTVAAVHGRALAGGAGMATACDMIVAQESSSFGYPEVRIGFVPAMVMSMLGRAVGEKVCLDLLLTGRVVSAVEAKSLGLVARVFPDVTFDADVVRFCDELASFPPGAVAATKALWRQTSGLEPSDAISLGAKANAEARSSAEFREGVEKFVRRGKQR